MEKKVGVHVFSFNPRDNGGEQLSLRTTFLDNGDGGILTNQELTLHSYCNQASIMLYGASITPEALRRLANELDEALVKAKAQV